MLKLKIFSIKTNNMYIFIFLFFFKHYQIIESYKEIIYLELFSLFYYLIKFHFIDCFYRLAIGSGIY